MPIGPIGRGAGGQEVVYPPSSSEQEPTSNQDEETTPTPAENGSEGNLDPNEQE